MIRDDHVSKTHLRTRLSGKYAPAGTVLLTLETELTEHQIIGKLTGTDPNEPVKGQGTVNLRWATPRPENDLEAEIALENLHYREVDRMKGELDSRPPLRIVR